jgi:hypothetical protein
MRPLPVLALPVLALAALAGCSRSRQSEPQGQADAKAAQPGPSAPADTAAPTPRGPTAYVNAVAVLRREPTDAARIPGKPGAKEVSNYLATLHRGEKVAVLEAREEWARVRSSDDSEGWMKRSSLLEQEGVTEATVLAPADVFDRPDLLAANAKRKVEAGTLVLVVKSRPPFSEVNVSGSQDAWVLTDRLNTSEKEISVAKLIEKERYLVRNNKKDDAMQLLALARQHFEGATLVSTLAAELGEAPAPPAVPTQAKEPAAGAADPASPGAAATQ